MKILQVDLNKDNPEVIKEAVAVLEAGGVIIYPTDTLYGIGCNALDEKAVKRIFDIKDRPLSKPLPMIVRDIKWVHDLAYVSKRQEEILNKIWPPGEGSRRGTSAGIASGRVTAVLNKRKIIPDILTSGHKTVGVRVPDYPLLDELLKLFGYPIVSTSANISGTEGTGDIGKIIEAFSGRFTKVPDLVLDVGILPKSEPSAILDLTGDQPKISRVGPSKPEEFLKLLNI